jgi:predicted glycoside hydrolase/deacetylase ChbG (UPF0249 family)
MKRLIVSADDFGLTGTINDGIVKAYRDGIVTNPGIMPTGEAFEDARRRLKELGIDDVSCHLALTETSPVSNAKSVPTLAAKDGRFPKSYPHLLAKLSAGLIRDEDIYLELKNQIELLRKAGLTILNLSSHEHIHLIPRIFDIVVRLAGKYGIRSIRHPAREATFGILGINELYRALVIPYFDNRIKKGLDRNGIIYPDHFSGFIYSGRLREKTLIRILKTLKDGTTELVCHPGFLGPEVLERYHFHTHCEEELFALTSPAVKRLIKEKDVKLISYRDLLVS